MANRFHGSYRNVYTKTRVFITNTGKRMETGPRGVRTEVQAMKREEAAARNAKTPFSRTRTARRDPSLTNEARWEASRKVAA